MKIPRKTYTLWRKRIIFLFLAVIVILFCCAVFFRWLILPTVLFFVALGVLLIILDIWLLPLYFKSFEISFSDSVISVSKGVIFKSKTVLPNKKLISVSRISLPDAQRYNLTAVFIRFYKGFIFIPEIDKSVAKEMILPLPEKK